MSTISIMVLVIQIIILLVEVIIAYKGYKSTQQNERGVFLLKRDGKGVVHQQYQKNYFCFDNSDYRYLQFYLSNANLIVHRIEIRIDGIKRNDQCVESNSIFVLDKEDNCIRVDLPLSQGIINSKRFDCEVLFELSTLSNLAYKEIIKMKFSKNQMDTDYWHLDYYLPRFEK